MISTENKYFIKSLRNKCSLNIYIGIYITFNSSRPGFLTCFQSNPEYCSSSLPPFFLL